MDTSSPPLTFASRIRELREAKGLSQSGLARKMGLRQPTISQWEAGRNTPNVTRLVDLADFIDGDVDELARLAAEATPAAAAPD